MGRGITFKTPSGYATTTHKCMFFMSSDKLFGKISISI